MRKVRLYKSRADKRCPGFQVADYPNGFLAELSIEDRHPIPAGFYWRQKFFTYVGTIAEAWIYREDFMMVADG